MAMGDDKQWICELGDGGVRLSFNPPSAILCDAGLSGWACLALPCLVPADDLCLLHKTRGLSVQYGASTVYGVCSQGSGRLRTGGLEEASVGQLS